MATSIAASTHVLQLSQLFPNLDSTVIESVLSANHQQLDLTIDHLLTMSIDADHDTHGSQARFIQDLRI